MLPVQPSGTAPFALSVLDNGRTGVGQTAQESFAAISAVAHDDAEEARRQARTGAMAMLRMVMRQSYKVLAPRRSRPTHRPCRSSRSWMRTPSVPAPAPVPRSPRTSTTCTSSPTSSTASWS